MNHLCLPVCGSVCLFSVCWTISDYLRNCLPVELFLLACLLNYVSLPAELCLLACWNLFASKIFCLPACKTFCLPGCKRFCLPACLQNCFRACLSACRTVCVLQCWQAYSCAFFVVAVAAMRWSVPSGTGLAVSNVDAVSNVVAVSNVDAVSNVVTVSNVIALSSIK